MLTVLLISTCCLFSIVSNVEAKKECSKDPTDIIFLVDDSSSLKVSDFRKELSFVNKLISFLDLSQGHYQVGVTTFSTDVHTYIKLGSIHSKYKIYSSVNKIPPTRGMTYLGKALNYSLREGFTVNGGSRNGATKILIIVTDGNTIDLVETMTASAILKGLKVKIIIIGIGAHLNWNTLQQIVSWPENIFQTNDFDELPKIADSLKSVVCKEITKPVTCSDVPTDIIFLVDDSSSLKDSDFQKELLFVSQLISFFDLRLSRYHVGVTTFSTDVHTHLKLGSTYDKEQIYSTVGNISPTKGMTYLGKALKHIIREGFTAAGVRRNGATKGLIIVTDGDTLDLEETVTASTLLQGIRVKIFVIGIGAHLNRTNLERIVSEPQYLFQTKDFDELPKIVHRVKSVVCKTDKTPVCAKCSLPATDLVFVVDSASLKDSNFKKELLFVNQLISFLDLTHNHYQVGISTFSSDVHTDMELGYSSDKTKIKSVINGIKPTQGLRFLEKALVQISNEMRSTHGRQRKGVRKVLVVITDGVAMDPLWALTMTQTLRLKEIELVAVGIGPHLDMNYLKQMVTRPQNAFQVQNFDALDVVAPSVRKAVCDDSTDCSVFE